MARLICSEIAIRNFLFNVSLWISCLDGQTVKSYILITLAPKEFVGNLILISLCTKMSNDFCTGGCAENTQLELKQLYTVGYCYCTLCHELTADLI